MTAYVTSAEEMAYHMGQTILIAHNQAALCHTLRVVLGFMPCVGTVRKASECASVVTQVAELRADAVVLPLAGPTDLDLMRQLRAAGFGGRMCRADHLKILMAKSPIVCTCPNAHWLICDTTAISSNG